jgi:uncharacterized protein (UPF0333 family)
MIKIFLNKEWEIQFNCQKVQNKKENKDNIYKLIWIFIIKVIKLKKKWWKTYRMEVYLIKKIIRWEI